MRAPTTPTPPPTPTTTRTAAFSVIPALDPDALEQDEHGYCIPPPTVVLIYLEAMLDQPQRAAARQLWSMSYPMLARFLSAFRYGLRDERAARPIQVAALAKIAVRLGCCKMWEGPGQGALIDLLDEEELGEVGDYTSPLDSALFQHPTAMFNPKGRTLALVTNPRHQDLPAAELELQVLLTSQPGIVPWITHREHGAYCPELNRTFVLARPDTPSLEPLGFWRYRGPGVD